MPGIHVKAKTAVQCKTEQDYGWDLLEEKSKSLPFFGVGRGLITNDGGKRLQQNKWIVKEYLNCIWQINIMLKLDICVML